MWLIGADHAEFMPLLHLETYFKIYWPHKIEKWILNMKDETSRFKSLKPRALIDWRAKNTFAEQNSIQKLSYWAILYDAPYGSKNYSQTLRTNVAAYVYAYNNTPITILNQEAQIMLMFETSPMT